MGGGANGSPESSKRGASDDALLELVRERGDEMSPAMRALVDVVRFWLGLFAVLGPLAAVWAGLLAMFTLYLRFGSLGLLAYFAIAMPATAGVIVGIRRLKRLVARKIAGGLRARLDGIGGGLTPAGFSLGPRRDEARPEDR